MLRKFTLANQKRAATRLALAEHDNSTVRSRSREDLDRQLSMVSTPNLQSDTNTAKIGTSRATTIKIGSDSDPVSK